MNREKLRIKILNLVEEFHKSGDLKPNFIKGKTTLPPSGKIIGSEELVLMTDAVLDGWLTSGRFNQLFESKLASYLGVKHALTTNSGSSANLLAFTALTSPSLGSRRLLPGDEVITVAAGFPTTVNPIVQNNCIPVFIDVDLKTYNINIDQLEKAFTNKTKAVMLAHTLGNPFNLNAVKTFASKNNLWLIEDCCDALGSQYNEQKVGTFGDLATLSFYPAHHITMGEGGAVFTNNSELKKCVESFRDWGRDCYCEPGCDNTCNKRYNWKLGSLPHGYDHKYVYSHMGYNLKITDIQAACGLAQLYKIDQFIDTRIRNFNYLHAKLKTLSEFLYLPEATENSNPAWFGYPITIKDNSGTDRLTLLKYLDQYNIGTRLLFSGNITRQPFFKDINYRTVGSLENTDFITTNTFWIGVYPGLTFENLDYIVNRLETYFGVNF